MTKPRTLALRPLFLVLALGLLGCAETATSTPQATTIPFDYSDSRLYVDARFEGGVAGPYILDTGASDTVVDTVQADAARLVPSETRSVGGAGAGTSISGVLASRTFFVAGVPHHPQGVSTLALSQLLPPFTGHRVDGIVGSAFFVEHVVALDFATHTIALFDPATFEYRGQGAEIPLQIVDGVPIASAVLTLPSGRPQTLRVLVDSGAKATLLLSEPFLDRTGLREQFGARIDSPLGAGVGGPTRYSFARATSLRLEAQTEADAMASPVIGMSLANSIRNADIDGLLGAEFLERYHVIFDYARQRMILEPRHDAPAPTFDMSGMYITANGADLRTFTVLTVYPNSPAQEASVQVGDRLVQIDGAPTTGMDLNAIRTLLRSQAGRVVRLTFVRGSMRREVQLTMRTLL